MRTKAVLWGSQSWLLPPFRRRIRITRPSKSAGWKAGGSQDWLPHGCCQLTLVCFFLASIATAAVDGTVTNRTTGKPQPDATVTLYKLGENGLESVESVKSDAQGKFRINQDLQGPRLLQSAYGGVTYNHMLPPRAPTTGVALDVYESSK